VRGAGDGVAEEVDAEGGHGLVVSLRCSEPQRSQRPQRNGCRVILGGI
jgi:hypothetical protein